MIYVGGVPFSIDSSSSSQEHGGDILVALMTDPILVSASSALNAIQEKNFSVFTESENFTQCKCVYVFQREYATVDPVLVDFVGTDEATTCVGIVIRNRASGMTSVAHMDSPNVVDTGLTQMLALAVSDDIDSEFDVHLLGGFDDASPQQASGGRKSERRRKKDGHSFPLCAKIVETLLKSREKFHIQTLHVLGRNTTWDLDGNAHPIFNGLLVETCSGSITPAKFDRTSRCPDEIVRRIRITASFEDLSWTGRLLETYDTKTDRFTIAPCTWSIRLPQIAMELRSLSDSDILHTCSTSPLDEGPDFVDNEKRIFDYLIQHPNWRETFPWRQSRIFERTPDDDDDGHWKRLSQQ